MPPTRLSLLIAAGVAAGLLTACGSSSADSDLTVYVGRNEALLTPLIQKFQEQTGLQVTARYAPTPETTATLLEEGDASPADVVVSQDAGALGVLGDRGLLDPLPADVRDGVPAQYSDADGRWIGVTGRSRVMVYNPATVREEDLPGRVEALTDPAWRSRVGFPPGNASFQSFVTGFRVARGDDAARAWLTGMAANDARTYDNNLLVLEAVESGALDVGLINHYYWYEKAADVGPAAMRSRLKFADPADPGALVNVSGAGVLSDDPDALTFVKFLVSEQAQQYFADTVYEYPLVAGVPTPADLPALSSLQGPVVDLSDLADLDTSVRMIREAGLA